MWGEGVWCERAPVVGRGKRGEVVGGRGRGTAWGRMVGWGGVRLP